MDTIDGWERALGVKPSLFHQVLRYPLYFPSTSRPSLASHPARTLATASLLYLHLLSLSYLSLSPSPYTRLNRLLRLSLLPVTFALLAKLFLAHRAGDIEPFNESGFGAVGVIVAARACILAFGLFGRARRVRWVGWQWYTRRELGWWTSPGGRAELKAYDAAVLRGTLPIAEEAEYPCWTPWKRLALAALFLASPRHLGFSTARPPSAYEHPARPLAHHLRTLLVAGAACDAIILLYSQHGPFCAFEPDPAKRPSIFDPLPAPYPDLPVSLRVAMHTLATGLVIKSSLHVFQSAFAVLSYGLLPSSLSAHFPFPSLNLLSPFALLNPFSSDALAPSSVRRFWSFAWHDLLSLDISHFAFLPVLRLTRSRLLALLSAFAFSGLLHGVSLHAVGLGSDYGMMMGVFLLQGVGVALEHVFKRATGMKVKESAGRVWTLLVVGAGGILLAEMVRLLSASSYPSATRLEQN
ncbi:hypothetical protein JCM10213_005204 [Rhodosporidiobolus nylandii]